MIRTYNPENVFVTLSFTPIIPLIPETTVNLSNWSTLAVNFAEDRYEFTTSTTGQITRSKIINKLGSVEIVTPEGSDVCKYLSKLINSNAKITISIVEKSGTDNLTEWILSDASVSSAGTGERARTNGERTWVLTGEISKWTEENYTS